MAKNSLDDYSPRENRGIKISDECVSDGYFYYQSKLSLFSQFDIFKVKFLL